MKKIRVIFMGTPSYATTILQSLIKESWIDVCAVFTQPDKPAGRGKKLNSPHIKTYLQENNINIKIFQPNGIKDNESIEIISSLKPDFIIVAAYGNILPEKILDIAPCINLHASILPKYRGASPIQYAILNDDMLSGVTAMKMEKGLDSGDMLGFSYVNAHNMDINMLFDTLSNKAAALTIETIKNFENIQPLKQNSSQATYAPKVLKEDGLVDFSFTCKKLIKKFLAYNYWPGLYLKNGIRIKIFTCSTKQHNFQQGTIVSIGEKNIDIACLDGIVSIYRLNPPSKQEMNASDFIRGKRLKIGDSIY